MLWILETTAIKETFLHDPEMTKQMYKSQDYIFTIQRMPLRCQEYRFIGQSEFGLQTSAFQWLNEWKLERRALLIYSATMQLFQLDIFHICVAFYPIKKRVKDVSHCLITICLATVSWAFPPRACCEDISVRHTMRQPCSRWALSRGVLASHSFFFIQHGCAFRCGWPTTQRLGHQLNAALNRFSLPLILNAKAATSKSGMPF